jgi:hypothetical protein
MAVKFDNNKHWTSIVCCQAGCTLSVDGLNSFQDIIGTRFKHSSA